MDASPYGEAHSNVGCVRHLSLLSVGSHRVGPTRKYDNGTDPTQTYTVRLATASITAGASNEQPTTGGKTP